MIHLGDARELLPASFGRPAVCITDPVWPNAPAGMFPGVDPTETARAVLRRVVDAGARRLVVVLGCDSDPRWLATVVPAEMRFVRTCWLRHAVPSFAGTILKSADVAHIFGDHKAVRPRRVLPGEVSQNSRIKVRAEGGGTHPCPRRIDHMLWLVDHFTVAGELVVDPFAGSGTTLEAAVRLGREPLGYEIDPTWHAEAASRLARARAA